MGTAVVSYASRSNARQVAKKSSTIKYHNSIATTNQMAPSKKKINKKKTSLKKQVSYAHS